MADDLQAFLMFCTLIAEAAYITLERELSKYHDPPQEK
jgi:hypothetical protein